MNIFNSKLLTILFEGKIIQTKFRKERVIMVAKLSLSNTLKLKKSPTYRLTIMIAI